MLIFLFIVLVGAGQRNGASILHRRRPLVVLPILETIHQDGAGIVGQVELHPILSGTVRAGLELRYRTRQAVISILVGLGNEISHRRRGNLCRFRTSFEALDGGIHHLVLLVLFVVLIGAVQRNGASILHRRRPLVVLPILETIHQDGAGIVGQVELHPILSGTVRAGLELRYRTRQAVISILVGLGNEIRHCRRGNLCRLRSSLEGLDGHIHDFVLVILLIVLVRTGQGHGSAVLHNAGPFFVFAVIEPVNQDGARIIGQVELHPILSGTVRAGLEGRNRTGQPVIGTFIRLGDEILHRRCGYLLLGIPLRLSVQGIQEGLVGHGLIHRIGRAKQVHVTTDDDFVAHLDLRILGREFLVLQVEGAVHVEGLGAILIGNVESTVPELRGIRLTDG